MPRRWGRCAAGALAALFTLHPLAARAEAEVDCLIEPWRTVTLSAAIEGVVEDVMVDRGDLVQPGQVVARLESAVESASVDLAAAQARATGRVQSGEARLDFAQTSLDRQQALEARQAASKSQRDEAFSAKRVAEAELLAAREAKDEAALELRRTKATLSRRTIKSPVKGVVVERILSPGEYADPPQILKVAELDPLRVEVFAPLELFGKITAGMQADVLPEKPVGGSHRATVKVVDPVIDPASATFGVRLELPNPSFAIPAGLRCRVRFPVDAAELPPRERGRERTRPAHPDAIAPGPPEL